MIETLVPTDIQTFLKHLSVAIELDQVRVDALPRERFSPAYSDSMWRAWRLDHRVTIDELLSTTDTIPPAVLGELTRIAITYEPALVRSVLLELFAEVIGGNYLHYNAERFFGWLIERLDEQHKCVPRQADAQASILQWLAITDPLRISKDPECGYGQP
ncbi:MULTISPECIES: hypothetical protein [unclassified Bradyrhizobium]|uniref:hypothetical protein n=1 Tax=unclassified Bradyrhizobium TaxID=2631580 RepID=UPI002FEF8A7F